MVSPYIISVILNTNRRDETLACLASIDPDGYAPQDVIVLDNASADGSVEAIHEQHPHVETLMLSENRGYAGNNNVGILAAMEKGADWVLLLNEDVVLAPDAISKLVDVINQDRTIGIVGPMVYHHDEPDTIQSAGGMLDSFWFASHRAQNERDTGQFAAPQEVDWISGCAILVRREVIEEIGALDERFFYYWEETEWCVRAKLAGWKIVHVPGARIWHKGVQRDYKPNPSTTYYWTRNWFLMLSKHHAPVRAWSFAIITILRTLTSWSLKPEWRWKRDHRDAMLAGVFDFIRGRWGMMGA